MDTKAPFDTGRLARTASKLGLPLVVLYGSWARKRPAPGPESDVDVAILGCAKERYWDCYKGLSECVAAGPLDLVRLDDADPLFRWEIMERAALLYGDPDLFCEYRAFAYRDFVDSADLLKLEDVLARKKLARLGEQLRAKA